MFHCHFIRQNYRNDCTGTKPDLHDDEGVIYNLLSHDIVTESVLLVATFKAGRSYKLINYRGLFKGIAAYGTIWGPRFRGGGGPERFSNISDIL